MITGDDIVPYIVTDELQTLAREKALKRTAYDNKFTHKKSATGKPEAVLGEYAVSIILTVSTGGTVQDAMDAVDNNTSKQWDMTINGSHVECKTKLSDWLELTGPKAAECSLTCYNAAYQASAYDYIVHCRCAKNYDVVYVLGWTTYNEFVSKATLRERGDIGSNGQLCAVTSYQMPARELRPMSELVRLMKAPRVVRLESHIDRPAGAVVT